MKSIDMYYGGVPVPAGSLDDYIIAIREGALWAAFLEGLLQIKIMWLGGKWVHDPAPD